ncbi:uncharacterized protein LOC114763093 [Neltuma alba]|uniref:uncharacterized protein LOC114763093 n=1 Tax=Neltuma alba TaxID=207710 RepID=UPI0010A4BC3E|nr:uncharacterized protein LOC114763093 [Prosopis alba]
MAGHQTDRADKWTIWDLVAVVSAINGLVCFALGDIYKKSFGKLGEVGLVIYLYVWLNVSTLIWVTQKVGKRKKTQKVEVSKGFQDLVLALTFGLTCFGSTIVDMLQTGKADVFSIISYGSFALMSLSMSRESKLGFETGFSSFFLSLFASQFPKINRLLAPIAIVLCSQSSGDPEEHKNGQSSNDHISLKEQTKGQDPPKRQEDNGHNPLPGNDPPKIVSDQNGI